MLLTLEISTGLMDHLACMQILPYDNKKYGLLTKCEVKTAGVLAKFFYLRVYGPRRSRGP